MCIRDSAYKMAQESMVLLENNGILPLKKDGIKVAVTGPNANDSVMQWGNYSGYPRHTVTILQGIEKKLKGRGTVKYIGGSGHTENVSRVSHFNELTTPDGKPGVAASYWNNTTMTGDVAATATYTSPVKLSNGGNTVFAPGVELENFTARYETVFTPQKDAEIHLYAEADEGYRFILNGDTLSNRFKQAHGVQKFGKTLKVKKGERYDIQIDYLQMSGMAHMQFDIYEEEQVSTASIVSQAADADVVLFVGGISPRLEGEEMKVDAYGFKGGDRTDIQLPACQRELIAALRQSGKKVVYVNCSGSAIALVPESESCDAILQAWYPGERGGDAVADILFGDYNPSGKLPVTFYRSVDDLPDFLDYKMTNRTYRYFTGTPLWHFGYGKSYTTFSFRKPKYRDGVLTVEVTNTGSLAGDEVVQVYVRRPADASGPQKTLRAFSRVSLEAGESRTVSIPLPRESFEMWDEATNTMHVISDRYEVMVGNSSRPEDLITIPVKIK